MSAKDLPNPMPRFGPQRRDRPIIATGETKYHGDPVAAVAAEDEGRPPSRPPHSSKSTTRSFPGCTRWRRHSRTTRPSSRDAPSLRPDGPHADSNVLHEHRHSQGDVDRAASDPDLVIVKGTYLFPMVTQFAIEPHAFMAAPDSDGIAVLERHPAPQQAPAVAELLKLPLAKVRVHAPDPGGAFRWQAARRAGRCLHGARDPADRSPVAHARGDVPSGSPGSGGGLRPHRIPEKRGPRLSGRRGELPDRRLRRRIADRTVARGTATPRWARIARRRRGSWRAACSRIPCRPPRSVGSAIRSRSGRSDRT